MNMIDRRRRRIARALLKGASLIALAVAAPLQAQESAVTESADGMVENRYFMMLMAQTFDGLQERSHSQKAGFARLRKGDESWINIDYGDGAMVIVRPGRISVGNFVNQTPTEIALAYDYRTHALRGNSVTSGYHNRYVRPLLGRSPPLGSDSAWEIRVTPEQMGVPGATGGALTIALKRRYFSHGGRQYVLIEYAAPAFNYKNAAGETIVHWARGAALADPGFGQIYWNGSLQRAVAQQADGDPRPYRFARTILAMDEAGKPLVDPADIPELKPYVADFYSKEATAPIPTVATRGEPDQTPLQLAALLDVVALSVAENSANQLGEAVGGYVHGETGRNVGTDVDTAVAETGREVRDIMGGLVAGYASPDEVTGLGLVPDKFVNALSGIANMRGQITEAEFIARTGITLNDLEALGRRAYALNQRTGQLQELVVVLRGQLDALTAQIPAAQAALQRATANAYSLDDLLRGTPTGRAYSQLHGLQQDAEKLRQEISAFDRMIQANVAAGEQAAQRLPVLSRLAEIAENNGLVRFAAKFGTALNDLGVARVFTVLGVTGTISSIATQRNNLGSFDPASPNLRLSGSYDTTGGFVSNIAMTALGTAGNIMSSVGRNVRSGQVIAAVADVFVAATGSATDLYMAYQAALHAEGEAAYAQRQLFLTQHRKVLHDIGQIQEGVDRFWEENERLGREMREYREQVRQEAANRPPSVNRDDWTDPRFDPATGLPIPDYWEWLKKNNPGELARLGIDPDAPVGGWPGGVRPAAPGTPPPTRVAQPRQPGGPGYPTAKPRTPEADANAAEAANDTGQASAGEEEQTGNATGPAADATAAAETASEGADRTAAQIAADAAEAADQIAEETAAELAAKAAEARGPDWAQEAPAELDVSPLDIDPVTFKPVTFTPVTFEPVKFEPVTWEPPKWVPPEFKPPKPLKLPWPDFGDDQYDFGGDPNNLAFDYGDMEGKVATDLKRWADWLETQNVRELERMARAAGYPNLASALTDAENLIKKARDQGFRQWAFGMPALSGSIGLWASAAQHDLARAQVLLGDLLAQSRDIFSTGGLSDIGISGFDLAYLLRDFGIQDGDIIDVELQQFGRTIFSTRLDLLNDGTRFLQTLRPGVAQLIITAVNEGFASPNTAEIQVDNVIRGEGTQSYSLNTGQTAVLRVEADAKLEDD